MKKLIFGLALMVAGLTPSFASAQNYCYPVQYNPCCNYGSFEGLYIGGNLGVITDHGYRNDLDDFFIDDSNWTISDTDFMIDFQPDHDWNSDAIWVGQILLNYRLGDFCCR